MAKKFSELTKDFSPERRRRVEAKKMELRQDMAFGKVRKSSDANPIHSTPALQNGTDETEFSPGQMVSLKSDPSKKGAVVEVLPGQPETRVKVFVGGSVRTYYASQLQAEEQS